MGRARKRERGADSHVESWPLRPTPVQRSTCETRFEAGRRMYNACLGEALRRSRAVRADPAWLAARAMPKGAPRTPEATARKEAFRAVDEAHGFTAEAMQSFGSALRVHWLREHVPAQEAQSLALRAFTTGRRHHLGLGGRPRFKPFGRGLRSMESKSKEGALRPVLDEAGVLTGLQWGRGLVITAAPAATEKSRNELLRISKMLSAGWLRSRIVRTVIRGRATYRAQFVCDGKPVQRHPVGTERVSFDLGPSVVEVVHETGSFTLPLVVDVNHRNLSDLESEMRRLQRRLDRQHRAASPECFAADGTHIKNGCLWKSPSKNATTTAAAIAENHRKVAARRKTSHNTAWNRIIAIGADIRAENLDYRFWQKQYPHSVKNRAPGMFVETGRRKAASAGGSFYEFSPWTTALSQTCVCGNKAKKSLSERTHRCAVCKLVAPRDRFSAYLGLWVSPVADPATGEITDLLDVEGARNGLLSRHDIVGHTAPSSIKQRGSRRGQQTHPRAVARRKARLRPGGDRAARGKPAQPVPTACATPTAKAAAA